MVFRRKSSGSDRLKQFRGRTGRQDVGVRLSETLGNGHDLLDCLSLTEDCFSRAGPKGAMMVHLGKAEISERKLLEMGKHFLYRRFAAAKPVQQPPQLSLIHIPCLSGVSYQQSAT